MASENVTETRPDWRDNVHGYTQLMGTMYLCARILHMFPRRAPTVTQLQEEFGMKRATAYRWRAAIADARGEFR